MTGEKNRYSSVEKLWKLDDETLKTPTHDEMVLYLLDEENLKKSIKTINKFLNKKKEFIIQLKESDKSLSDILKKLKLKIDSEVPIMTERNFLVGYFDIVITLFDNPYSYENEGRFRVDYSQKLDVFHRYFRKERFPNKLFIEVKPYINSFGATLRQLRTYQEYYPECKGRLILFTKDSRFKDAFKSQGIYVLIQKE